MGGVKLRKRQKRLLARIKEWESHGPRPRQNPGKVSPVPMLMHRPGGKR